MILLPKRKPWRSERYLQFVRSLPCAVTIRPGVDPHHQIGHGQGKMGGTSSDIRAIPLTRAIHDELHRGVQTWEDKYGDQRDFILSTIERALEAGVLIINPEWRP